MSKFIYFFYFIALIFFSSCTYSITLVHTEGQATDVVDETATNTPSTSVSVPISATSLPEFPAASTVIK